jgi:hypothetical protein
MTERKLPGDRRRVTPPLPGYSSGVTSADDLAGLRRKYEEIVRLRRLEEAGDGGDPRRAMAALAAEFPGALREADDLPMDELLLRVTARSGALQGEAVAPWMRTMARFHALTRGALCAKRWLGGRKTANDDLLAAFDRESGALCYADDARTWRNELLAVAAPPRGRVTELVFARMALELGVSADEVRREVFGVGRVTR